VNVSIAGKTLFAGVLESTGILKRYLGRRTGRSVILMYHRVLPRGEAERCSVQPGMFVDPGSFDLHLRFLEQHFQVIPLSDFPAVLEGGRDPGGKPFCILTFDDGWRDVRIHAFPLLQRYGMPATVFLPTDFVGTGRRFWTDRVIEQIDRLEKVRDVGEPIPGGLTEMTGNRTARIEKAIATMKGMQEERIERILDALAGTGGERNRPMEPDFLSWEEVRGMHGSGLVSFGSHSATHRILTNLSPEEVLEELVRSRDAIFSEGAADPKGLPFCYPNGDFDDRTAAMVRECGYRLAVTTERGWNSADSDLFTLRRIGIHDDMSRTRSMFGCRVAGIFR